MFLTFLIPDSEYKNLISLLLGSYHAHVTQLSFKSNNVPKNTQAEQKKILEIKDLSRNTDNTIQRLGNRFQYNSFICMYSN